MVELKRLIDRLKGPVARGIRFWLPLVRLPPHLFATFFLGIISQIGQVLLLRELLMVFHGNELTIGLILAAWLAWVGVGSRLAGYLSERINRPLLVLVSSSVAVLIIFPVKIYIIRILRGFFEVSPGAYLSLPEVVLASFLIMAPLCFLLGLQFVLLSRIWREARRLDDTSGAGDAYIGEALGNTVGGILFAFLLVHYLNPFQLAVIVAGLMIAAVILLGRSSSRLSENTSFVRWVLIGSLVMAGLVFPFLEELDQWAYRVQWQRFAPRYEFVETRQSKHGTITVVRREDQYSFFQSGQLIFSTAGPEALASGLEEQEAAVFAHMSMLQHREPNQVLLIGGAMRGTLGEIIKHPVDRVDYVEIDEVLLETSRPYVSRSTRQALEDHRVNVSHVDGRLFVKTTDKSYDMIIVDVPDPTTADLNRYYTEEFFREAKESLASDGVLVIGANSTPDLRGQAVANRNTTLYHTLKKNFSRVLPAGERFLFYFATNEADQISSDPSALGERFLERKVEAQAFSPVRLRMLLEETPLRRLNWIIRNHGRRTGAHLSEPSFGPLSLPSIVQQERTEDELPPVNERYFVNRDFRPIGYFYTLIFWNQLTRADPGWVLQSFLRVEFWWIALLFLVPVVLWLALKAKSPFMSHDDSSDEYFAVNFAVFTTGLSTMALQIALVFSFQSVYGFVYEMVGFIVALFMLGLATGAYIANRFVSLKGDLGTLAAVQLLMAVLAAIIGLALPQSAGLESPGLIFLLFSLLTFSAGLLNGLDFPLAVECCRVIIGDPDESAGIIYGVELFGACLGAVLASVLIAPVFGVRSSCFFAALASLTAFVILLASRRWGRIG